MPLLRVWAPQARQVSVDLTGSRQAMRHGHRGVWSLDVPQLVHGEPYSFYVDGEGPFPDPRSAWQPRGIFGPSAWVDHAQFPWDEPADRQPAALDDAVIYELHVGTFTPEGTFDAAIDRLDHLVHLGVTHLELMPVAEFSGLHGWGYDGVDLFAPHHAYGGPDGLKRLVQAAHHRGLAVIIDVVYNHLGPAGNFLGRYGPYFSDWHRNPWGQGVNLDGPGSDEVRGFFIDNALHWLRDYHCDGLRLDAVHAIFDRSAVHFLEELARRVRALQGRLGRPLVVIAESDLNDPRLLRAPSLGGYGLDALWADDFHHAFHALLTGERQGYYGDFGGVSPLAKALRQAFVYDGLYSAFRQRHFGRPATGCRGQQFVACIQNHDQVGNRRRGERLSQLVGQAEQRLAAALLLFSPFVPLLFQGQEWGASTPFLYFTDHQDPQLAQAVSEGRRQEFPAEAGVGAPDPQAKRSFLDSKLKWEELGLPPHSDLLTWYRHLIALRREWSCLRDGDLGALRLAFSEEEGWLTLGRGPLVLACNFTADARWLPWTADGPQTLLLESRVGAEIGLQGLYLPPHGAAVFGPEGLPQ